MNQEGTVPWVLKEVTLVSLSPLPPLFTTSILELVSVSWQNLLFLNNRTLK